MRLRASLYLVMAASVLGLALAFTFSPLFFVFTALPGLTYTLLVWRKEKVEREPLVAVFAIFSYGFVVSTLVALIMEVTFEPYMYSVLTVPIVEELAKLLGVYTISRHRSVFNELDDGIVYGASAGLGFATLESMIYSVENPVIVGLLRAISSTLGHAASSAVLGYGYAKYFFDGETKTAYVCLALAILLHALHNFLVETEMAYWAFPLDIFAFVAVIKKLE